MPEENPQMTATSEAKETEQVEGLGGSQIDLLSDNSIDALMIRTETRTVHDVLRRIEDDRFVMNPDFQRDFIWDKNKQSKLIESVMMRIPLPVFYLAEDDEGRMVVVDGLQRLSTFQRFVNNDLLLSLPRSSELDKKYFRDLPPKFQNRVEDCNLILYVIDSKVPEQARLDIFDRVNRGVPLTRQQMRNCLYMGKATRFLKEQSQEEIFVEATGRSLKSSTMRDREFVNRFCSFQSLGLEYYKDMDQFLRDGLKKMNDQPDSLPALSSQLKTTLENNSRLFGRHAFRKSRGQEKRSMINASLWDVMSTGLSRYPQEMVSEKADEMRSAFYRLLTDEEFVAAITRSTDDIRQIKCRFSMAGAMFKEVFGADTA